MTQKTEYKPEEIAAMAALVAAEMTNETRTKKHGGYVIYRDGKIRVSLDTYVANIHVQIIREGNEETVYSAGYRNHASPGHFHPGLWIDYLAGLYEQAKELRDQRKARLEEKLKTEREAKFAPVDDHEIFAGE